MICTSASGITISSSERPNIVCGSIRFIQLRCRTTTASAATSGGGAIRGAVAAVMSAAMTLASLGLEGIASAADGLQVARVARVGFDLAAQPRHLYVDIADVAAELRRLRQVLARHRLPGTRRKARQQSSLGGGEAHDLAAAEQLAARRIEAEGAKAQRRRGIVGGAAAGEDVADAQDKLARLEWLRQIIVGALFEAV